jgi:hypothetical protein
MFFRLAGMVLPVLVAASLPVQAHDIITTKITFDREISRIIYARCASCHRRGGTAFSLLTYAEARPWAVAIKEEVLSRRMPPWGAVKGFGEFREDQALTPEQMELVTSWVEGGVPEGEEKDLLPAPKPETTVTKHPQIAAVASGPLTLKQPLTLAGLLPQLIPEKASIRITANLPDGSVEPLLWLETYKAQFGHAFWFRTPLNLPAGTVIKGVPSNAKVALLPKSQS